MDKLYNQQKERVQQISYKHTLGLMDGKLSIVFYDVTTLHFEAEEEDELRQLGFSKAGKHRNPQILLGLLVSQRGYPLAYEVFQGSTYEGHTLIPIIERFKQKYQIEQLIVIADAGLLTSRNIEALQVHQYEFILGVRIKNQSNEIRKTILSLSLKNGESSLLYTPDNLRLIVNYSEK